MRIVVSEINNRSVGFLVEDGRLIEVFRAGNGQTENGREGKSPEHFRVGEILVGRVRDVRSGLSAAFVNLSESSKEMEALGGAAYLPFSELPAGMSLRPEQLLPVQIVALPSGSKPFRVTSKLSLSGRYCAVGENIRGIQASKKLPRPMASKLKEQVRDYFGYHAVPGSAGTPAGEKEDGERNGTGTSPVSAVPESPEKIPFSGDVGIMIRTNARIPAEEGNPEAVTEEAESLMRKLRQIRAAAAARTGGSVLYPGDDELYGKIRDCIPEKIIIDTGVPEEIRKKEKQRRPAARLILPEEEVRFTDGHFGSQAFNLARDWGDIIIRRSDGVFAYQLAVTIDDGLLGVTQVVRGWDLLSSSAPQIYLFRLLGFDTPRYLHLPLLITEDGARLAKRDKAADVGFLRSQLPGPEPLVGYIAYLLGQIDKPEAMTATELLPLFDDKKIPGHDIVIPGNYWEHL